MNETPTDPAPSGVRSGTIDSRRLERLCRRADDILWDGHRFALGAADAPWPRLIFPLKGRDWRVGEQEARLAFVAALLDDADAEPWAFAAEAPTRLSYRSAQRGAAKAQRGLLDLALYRQTHDGPALAVQFKSGGRSGKSEIDESVREDVARILAEQPDALWFHVVRDVNSATLQGLLRTLDAAISRLSNPFKLRDYLAPGKTVEPRAKTITVHVCVLNLDTTLSIHRALVYVPGKPERDFFTIAAAATGTSLDIADRRGWSVYRGTPAATL